MKKLAAVLSLFCFMQMSHANVANDTRSSYSSPAKVKQPKFQVPIQTHYDGAPDGIGFFTFGEFLYWVANEDGLQPAVKLVQATNPAFGFFQVLKFDRFQFHFDPGFRVGLGYHLDQRNWDIESIWTQYHTRWASPFLSDPGEQLDLLWGDPGGSVGSATLFDGAQRFKLRYNTVDLVLKPSFLRFDYFSLQPKIGVRGAWIIQNIILTVNGFHNLVNAQMEGTARFINDFRSIGLLAGLDMKWHLGFGFSLLGDISGSFGYGRFKVDERFSAFFASAPFNPAGAATDLHNKVMGLSPNMRIALGLQWDRAFYHEKLYWMFRAGYEQLIWFNQNHFEALYFEDIGGGVPIINEPRRRPGNLGLSGWMFSAGLGF